MKNIFFVVLFVTLVSLTGAQNAKAQNAITVTCYNDCSPVYSNHVGVVSLDLQCNASSPASYTGQLTVNGVSTPVSTKTCVPPFGTVNTSSNIYSSWSITGPATITGYGNSQSSPSKPVGTYIITWNPVAGYTTPASQTLTLAPGGAVSFSGIYSAASLPTPTTTAPTTPAPVPTTPSSAPTATLTVSPNPASYGTRSTLTWSSTNATSCVAGGAWSNQGTLSGSGLTDPLTAPATYTFQCTGPGGTSPIQSVAVGVNAPVVCATGLAYDAATHSCIACSNGGCTGAGGTPTIPVGGLTCNNGTTNPPTCTQASPAPAAVPATPTQPAAPAPANPTPPAAPAVFPCSIWGTTVFDGDSVTAYQFIAVKSPKTCASISELRKCTGGTLSGSFVNQYCKVMPTYNAF